MKGLPWSSANVPMLSSKIAARISIDQNPVLVGTSCIFILLKVFRDENHEGGLLHKYTLVALDVIDGFYSRSSFHEIEFLSTLPWSTESVSRLSSDIVDRISVAQNPVWVGASCIYLLLKKFPDTENKEYLHRKYGLVALSIIKGFYPDCFNELGGVYE
ncbi:hypothetical protein [Xenorhabdus sp. PB30.3]|uniref:hypothetical protein n=1 Tax=Xenorhabdus sp. PB30.3 TaxID=2788941 RepID=UPI001E31E4B3|nr:hypothetical protein [Xenorhabdus sp. PB30.3]MCC8379099.1 hypothetical protein [Xenorhabdus sp. PB30.3]